MPSYSAKIEIAAPQAAVYDLVAAVTRHGEWSADPLEIVALTDDTWRSTSRSKGKTITAEIHLVERQPPTRLVFDAVDLTGRWRHTFTFAPTGTGTTVTRRISGSLRTAQLLLYWLVVLPIKKPNAARALGRLRGMLEQEPAG